MPCAALPLHNRPGERASMECIWEAERVMVPCQVLVVDDDREIRESLVWLLTDAGYGACQAEDGRVALAILHESAFPMVVLLDYRMPDMDGEAVLRAVTADADLKRHAYVLITAERAVVTKGVEQLLAQIAAPVIEKPFDLDAVLQVVDTAAQRIVWAPPVEGGAHWAPGIAG
jgi:DNA-binding NtrC family response regulator